MGNTPLPPVSDIRVDKCIKKLHLKTDEVNKLWLVFSAHDREGVGLISRKDFFDKIVEEDRTFFGDAVVDFVEPDSHDVLNFGEFMEVICIFSLFEKYDVLRFLFYLFDKKKSGYIDRDELKHFIISLHGGQVKSNAQMGLASIEEKKTSDGRFAFRELAVLHRQFPHLLYPVFRLQTSMMRESFGESWWEKRKILLGEEARLLRAKEKKHTSNKKEDEAAKEEKVKEAMGVYKYYLTPWKRKAVRIKIEKMDKIEAELLKREEIGEVDDDEELQ
mmetsp:Transcript_16683/g.25085  ORF Transcript_16683/g.25085 Transcript_16683/m.25085 type:complete len:275 (+) Transcript_16683:92-916(+)